MNWKADIQYIFQVFQQIILTTSFPVKKEVKAIRTAGSNADWQQSLPLLIELKAQIL